MLYIALGNDKQWKRFSDAKPITWIGKSQGDDLVFEVAKTDWYARQSCMLTHWYILSERKDVLRKIPLDKPIHVPKRTNVSLVDCAIIATGELFSLSESKTPYLV